MPQLTNYLKNCFRESLLLAIPLALFGQDSDADLKQVHGQMLSYSGKPGPPGFYNNSSFSPAAVAAMRPLLEKICDQAENTGPMGSLTGFTLRRRIDINLPSAYNIPADRAYLQSVWVAMFHFIRMNGRIQQYVETAAGINIDINSLFGLAPEEQIVGTSYQDCHVPYFFQQSYLRLTQNSDGCYEMTDRDNYTRVYTNGKPLFIPYTNEQLLTYYVKFYQLQAGKLKETIAGTRKQMEDDKLNPYTGKPYTAAEQGSESYKISQTAIKALQESITPYQQQLDSYYRLASAYDGKLRGMTEQQRREPAYVHPDQRDEIGMTLPAEANDENAMALLTVNPDYFNPALPKTAIQLVRIKFYGLDPNSDFILSKVLGKVFDAFDFNAIKSLIK